MVFREIASLFCMEQQITPIGLPSKTALPQFKCSCERPDSRLSFKLSLKCLKVALFFTWGSSKSPKICSCGTPWGRYIPHSSVAKLFFAFHIKLSLRIFTNLLLAPEILLVLRNIKGCKWQNLSLERGFGGMDPKWTKDLRLALDFEPYFVEQTPPIVEKISKRK